MAIEDEMKKIEETKGGRGDTNIFGTRRLGAVLEEKIPDWMGSVKGIVEKGKQNVETFETLEQGRSVRGGYFRKDDGSDIRILNDNVKDYYQEGVYENLEPKEIMLNAFYLQDMIRNGIKQGGEFSDELSNYNSHNAIAAIQENLLANGKTEEEVEQAYEEAVALYKQRDFTAITPNNREELRKKISPLGATMFRDLAINNKIEADRVVENTKDLFKSPFRFVALNLALPKEAVFDLPAVFMDPNDVAGYQKRLENPFGQEQWEEYQRSGKSMLSSSPIIRSGAYYFGKLFQDIANDELAYGGDLKYNKRKADQIDVGGQLVSGGGVEYLFKTGRGTIKYLQSDEAKAALHKVLEKDLKGIFKGKGKSIESLARFGVTQGGASRRLSRMRQLEELGENAYKINIAKDIAFGNVGMTGAYGILTGIGEMEVGEQRRDGSFATLNDNVIYNFLKLPLLGVGLIGGQKLFGVSDFVLGGKEETTNLMKKMAFVLSDDGRQKGDREFLIEVLGYNPDKIKNLDATQLEELVDISKQDMSQLRDFSITIKKLQQSANKADRDAAKDIIDSFETTLALRNDMLKIAARRKGFKNVDDMMNTNPKVAEDLDLLLDQVLMSDSLRGIRLAAKEDVNLGLKQGLSAADMQGRAQKMLEKENAQRARIKDLLDDILGDDEQAAFEASENILQAVRRRNNNIMESNQIELNSMEDLLAKQKDEQYKKYRQTIYGDDTEEVEILRPIKNADSMKAKQETINSLNKNYVPDSKKTGEQLNEMGQEQSSYIKNARKKALKRKDEAYEQAFQDVGQEELVGDDFVNFLDSQDPDGMKESFPELFEYVSSSSFGRDRSAAVKGVAQTPDMGFAINKLLKQVQVDYVNKLNKENLLIDNLNRMTANTKNRDAINERIIETINTQREVNNLDLVSSLDDLTVDELKRVNKQLINRAEQFGVDPGESLLRLDDLHFMKKGIDLRIRKGLEGDELFDAAQTSNQLKELLDIGSEIVAMKKGVEVFTYKEASDVFHETYIKPYARGTGYKPFKEDVTGDIKQPTFEIFEDFLTDSDHIKVEAQLDQILKDGGEEGNMIIRNAIANVIDNNRENTLNPITLKKLADRDIIPQEVVDNIDDLNGVPFAKNAEREMEKSGKRLMDALKRTQNRLSEEDRLFNVLGKQGTDSYLELFQTLNKFSSTKDVKRLDDTIREIAKGYEGVDEAARIEAVKSDMLRLSSQVINEDVTIMSQSINRKSFEEFKKNRKDLFVKDLTETDIKILWQEEVDTRLFQQSLKKHKELFRYLDPEHADDLEKLFQFSVVVGDGTSAIGVRGLARPMSAESGMSRVYGVVRGVVSPRYVASEITLQLFRRKRLKALQDVISNPRSADVLAKALQKDSWESVRFRNKWIGMIRGMFAISEDVSDDEILDSAEKEYGFEINR
tara:strand:+ start:5174 stop:9439 length:4266 start_codon:yes stop_codon:yes gene_type:complete